MTARFGVDPAELISAAGAARDVQAQLVLVAEALGSVQPGGVSRWAPDMRLAAVAKRAVDALRAATDVAATRCAALEHGLAVSAESYARSDGRWVR